MPPKVLYGKRRPVSQTQTSYSKFLSPKDNDGHGEDKKDGAYADWKQQLEYAAAGQHEDALVALQKGLENLDLEHKSRVGETKLVGKKEAHEGRSQNHTSGKEPSTLEETRSKKSTAAKSLDDKAAGQEKSVTKGQRNRSQKAQHNRGTDNVRRPSQSNSDGVKAARENSVQDNKDSSPSTLAPKHKTPSRPKPNRRSKKQQLPTPEPTPEPSDIYTEYISPLLSLSLGGKVISFDQWSTDLEPHFEITKIAEASFSEVYRLSARSRTSVREQESVLKVVALKTPFDAPLPCQMHSRAVRDREGQILKERAERDDNDVWKSDVADVVSEVKLLQNLNHIPGFTNFRDLTILQGRPSPSFSNAWKTWNKSRPRGKKSEFPDPSKKSNYDDNQLWAIVEMQDAGTDCEKLMEANALSSIWEIWDVFWGVCLSVAKAEETCRFEHRDLHMGNICVRPTRQGNDLVKCPAQDPLHCKLRFTGLETTVIDYTLSRADVLMSASRRSSSLTITSDSGVSACTLDISASGVAYLDLDRDPAIFEGDASEEYQYEIYRYMRGVALYNKPLQQNGPVEEIPAEPRRSPRKNNHIRFDEEAAPHPTPRKITPISVTTSTENVWEAFHPKTNLVWTHFLLHKLMKHLTAAGNVPVKLSTRQIMASVSTEDQVSDPLKVKKKAMKLYKVLERVSDLLCPVALGKQDSIGSVKELVVLALEERWLRVDDVAG